MLMTRVPAVDTADRSGVPSAPARWTAAVAFAVAVACCGPVGLLAWLLGAGAHPGAGLALFALVAAGLAALSGALGAAGAAMLMWAGDDGFVIHRFGVLSLDAPSVSALVVIAAVAVIGCAGGGLVRSVRGQGMKR